MSKYIFILVTLFISSINCTSFDLLSQYYDLPINEAEDILVTIKNGTVRGTTTTSINKRTIYAFKGIPYAEPPIGDLRFEPPKPHLTAWEGILNATKTPPACPQFLTAMSPASEDCLYLTVYTPIKPQTSTDKLPVMVYVYGGGFLLGDTVIYGPNRLMAHDVVLVMMHYRLGPIGFLSTGDEVVPGNNGLKDQVLALKWVQENIEAFNGDPNSVTIFGESAGSASVLYHLISPTTTGLFHRVIAQSGTPLSIWARDNQPVKSAQRYAASLNCTIETSRAMVDCLRNKTWQELSQRSFYNLLEDISNLKLIFEASAPVVEPDLPGAFLSKEPIELLKEGNFNSSIPVILGTNQHEGSAILAAAYVFNFRRNGQLEDPEFVRDELLPVLLKAVQLDETKGGTPAAQSLALYYYPEGAQKDNFTQITDALVDMLSVFTFKASVLRTADILSQHLDNVYLYSLEREGFNTLWSLLFDLLGPLLGQESPPIKHGVMHADDLQYLFTLPFIIIGDDRKFSDMLTNIWTKFATTGDPNLSDGGLPKWNQYKMSEPNYYKLDVVPEALSDFTKNWRLGYKN